MVVLIELLFKEFMKFIIVIFSLLFLGCEESNSLDIIQHIDGLLKIESVKGETVQASITNDSNQNLFLPSLNSDIPVLRVEYLLDSEWVTDPQSSMVKARYILKPSQKFIFSKNLIRKKDRKYRISILITQEKTDLKFKVNADI
jgi:hypothetical protein